MMASPSLGRKRGAILRLFQSGLMMIKTINCSFGIRIIRIFVVNDRDNKLMFLYFFVAMNVTYHAL